MSDSSPEEISPANIVYIQFHKKIGFPSGEWLREPDYCLWEAYDYLCLALRDTKLGVWKGFVGLPKEHVAYLKSPLEIINEEWGIKIVVHGGISSAGKLPPKYKSLNKDTWWIGFECSKGEDMMPLVKLDKADPMSEQIIAGQTYKNLLFVRKEVHCLAKQLVKINANHNKALSK